MRNISIYCGLALTCLLATSKAKYYGLKADDLMESMLKDTYKGKFQRRFSTSNSTDVSSGMTAETVSTTPPHIRTTNTVLLAKPKPVHNMTLEEFYFRKRNLDLRMILEFTDYKPNFKSEDELIVQTRRFNSIKQSEPKDALREVYFEEDNPTAIYKEKVQILHLMTQFIYETRYHLPYAQKLRRKYRNHVKYQIGYCIALVRILKLHQKVFYTTLRSYYGRRDGSVIRTMYTHLTLYEKIVRLDVDVKDVIRLILQLDKKMKLLSTVPTDKPTTTRPY